jgi:TonB family protein
VKLGSLKFCLLLSLLCHVAGFAAYEMFAPAAASQNSAAPISIPVVVFSTDAVAEKISTAPTAKPTLDKKFGKLFATEKIVPLKKLAVSSADKIPREEQQFAELAGGQTVVGKSLRLSEPASNNVIVGTRISRVFAVANIQPEYYKNPKPEYPEAARRAHQEGIVWLRVHVTARGKPDRVAVLETSGFDALDDAAISAVRGWEFTPAQLGEVLVESEIDFPIQFRLE